MSDAPKPSSCDGRVALVTGASQGGTGTAIAVRLAAEGAKVAISARSEQGLEETAARVLADRGFSSLAEVFDSVAGPLYLASVGGGVARDALLAHSLGGVRRILASN